MVGPHYTANLTLDEKAVESQKATVGILPADKDDGLVIGSAVGGLLLLSLIVTVVVFIIRRKIHQDVPIILPADTTTVTKTEQPKTETTHTPSTTSTTFPSLLTTTTTIGSSLNSNQLDQSDYFMPSHSYVDFESAPHLRPPHGYVQDNSNQGKSSPSPNSTILVTPKIQIRNIQEREVRNNAVEIINGCNPMPATTGNDVTDLGRQGNCEEQREESPEIESTEEQELGPYKVLNISETGIPTGNDAGSSVPDICFNSDEVSLKGNDSPMLPKDDMLSSSALSIPLQSAKPTPPTTNVEGKRDSWPVVDLNKTAFYDPNSDSDIGNSNHCNSIGSLVLEMEGYADDVFSNNTQKTVEVKNFDKTKSNMGTASQARENNSSGFNSKSSPSVKKNNKYGKTLKLGIQGLKTNCQKTNNDTTNSCSKQRQIFPVSSLAQEDHGEPVFWKSDRNTETMRECNLNRRRSSFPPESFDKCYGQRLDLNEHRVSEGLSQTGSFKLAALGLLQRLYNKENRYRATSDTSCNASYDKINNAAQCHQAHLSLGPGNMNKVKFYNLNEQNLGITPKAVEQGEIAVSQSQKGVTSSGIHIPTNIDCSSETKLPSCKEMSEIVNFIQYSKSGDAEEDARVVSKDKLYTPERSHWQSSPMPSPRCIYYERSSVHKTQFPFSLVPGKRQSMSQASSFPLASLRFDDSYLDLHDNKYTVSKKSEVNQDEMNKYSNGVGRNYITGDETKGSSGVWTLKEVKKFGSQETENTKRSRTANDSYSVENEKISPGDVMTRKNRKLKNVDLNNLRFITEQNQNDTFQADQISLKPTSYERKESKTPAETTHSLQASYTCGAPYSLDSQWESSILTTDWKISKRDDSLTNYVELTNTLPPVFNLPSPSSLDLASEGVIPALSLECDTCALDPYLPSSATGNDLKSVSTRTGESIAPGFTLPEAQTKQKSLSSTESMAVISAFSRLDKWDTKCPHTNKQLEDLQDVHKRGFPLCDLCDLTTNVSSAMNISHQEGTVQNSNAGTIMKMNSQVRTSFAASPSTNQRLRKISDELKHAGKWVPPNVETDKKLNDTSSRHSATASQKNSVEQVQKVPFFPSSHVRHPSFSIPQSGTSQGEENTLGQGNYKEPENLFWRNSLHQKFLHHSSRLAPLPFRSRPISRNIYPHISDQSYQLPSTNRWLSKKDCSMRENNESDRCSNPHPFVFSRHMNTSRNRKNIKAHINSHSLSDLLRDFPFRAVQLASSPSIPSSS